MARNLFEDRKPSHGVGRKQGQIQRVLIAQVMCWDSRLGKGERVKTAVKGCGVRTATFNGREVREFGRRN